LPTQNHLDNGRYLLDAFTKRTFSGLLTADVILHDKPQQTSVLGQAAVEAFLNAFFRDGFSEATIVGAVEEATADCLVLSLRWRGVQNGRFMGIPATGRAVKLSLTLVCRLRQGQIYHLDLNYDAAALLRQLGLAL
jgi:hypothetical protein